MFYPPVLLDLTQTPTPAPHFDTPIARHDSMRALAVRIARGARRSRPPASCPGPRPESSF